MKSKNELKETDIKNLVCYYFDNKIINGTKTNFRNIFLEYFHRNKYYYK